MTDAPSIAELQSQLLSKDDELKKTTAERDVLRQEVEGLKREKIDLANLNAKLMLRAGVTTETHADDNVVPTDPGEYLNYWLNKKKGKK